jgi:hypothetical protein
MHYLYQINRLQPQRPLNRTQIVGYNMKDAETNQLFFALF